MKHSTKALTVEKFFRLFIVERNLFEIYLRNFKQFFVAVVLKTFAKKKYVLLGSIRCKHISRWQYLSLRKSALIKIFSSWKNPAGYHLWLVTPSSTDGTLFVPCQWRQVGTGALPSLQVVVVDTGKMIGTRSRPACRPTSRSRFRFPLPENKHNCNANWSNHVLSSLKGSKQCFWNTDCRNFKLIAKATIMATLILLIQNCLTGLARDWQKTRGRI